MAKRSPILGYNHNVKYRGIVFHVQTEDSGLLSPHLFTHLFHEGVIVSTRKLVYDPGANEEAVKALMQAQHKAVMKDLKKGSFDDKIDAYLGGTPGLEPSTVTRESQPVVVAPAPVAAAPEPPAPPPVERLERAPTEVDPAIPLEMLPANADSVPIELIKPRTRTAQRSSPQGSSPPRNEPAPPPPMDEEPATTLDTAGSVAAAVAAANTATAKPAVARTATPPSAPTARAPAPPRPPPPVSSVLELDLEDDDGGPATRRVPRDTALEIPQEVTIPPRPRTSDGIPRMDAPRDHSQPNLRQASHGAAALPPMKPPSRPSISPPVAPPAPPAANRTPTGEDDRPGSYSLGRTKPSPENVNLREKTGRIPAVQSGSGPHRATPPVAPPAPPPPPPKMQQPSHLMRSDGVPQQQRAPNVTAPITNRPQAGVVMSRPAVIVGAPPKQVGQQAAAPRVRKAREEEGRGFGQGLISEKSLDEVILAYLSEDADDK